MPDLKDQTVVVTGASGNLGSAVAQLFHAQGARLALIDMDSRRLEAIAQPLGALAISCDLTREVAVQECFNRIASQLGGVDVLANIAGGFRMGPPLHETPTADWDFMLDLNARSVFNTCRAAIPYMLRLGHGRIVNVSARAAEQPKAKMAPYIASKAAVAALTEALAAEHKHTGININGILPGTIDTPENRASMPDADFTKWVAPSALAEVIVWLSSESARAVNGALIPVYGQS